MHRRPYRSICRGNGRIRRRDGGGSILSAVLVYGAPGHSEIWNHPGPIEPQANTRRLQRPTPFLAWTSGQRAAGYLHEVGDDAAQQFGLRRWVLGRRTTRLDDAPDVAGVDELIRADCYCKRYSLIDLKEASLGSSAATPAASAAASRAT